IVSAIGLYFSYDRPSGPTIMVCFAAALILGGVARAIATAERRSRAIAVTAAAVLAITAVRFALPRVRPPPAAHPGEAAAADAADGDDEAAKPEHGVAPGVDGLRAALRDTHENVRAKAVAELEATGDLRILPDLVAALHDQSPAVREAAAAALARA